MEQVQIKTQMQFQMNVKLTVIQMAFLTFGKSRKIKQAIATRILFQTIVISQTAQAKM